MTYTEISKISINKQNNDSHITNDRSVVLAFERGPATLDLFLMNSVININSIHQSSIELYEHTNSP